MISFVGSVFSPWYHWSGRGDPDNHVCINVALYAPERKHWTMTERSRAALSRSAQEFRVGPSRLFIEDGAAIIEFDEIAVPRPPAEWLPTRVKGRIRFEPSMVTGRVFDIGGEGRHRWWPVAPAGRISVTFETGGTDWSGHGYMDSNWGLEPLEQTFDTWDWARGTTRNGDALILYDTVEYSGAKTRLAVRIGPDGEASHLPMPDKTALKRGFWGVGANGHHDPGINPSIVQRLEDGPFYRRSVVRTRLFGEDIDLMHESLSGRRYASPFVKLMLPFRMPRRR